jgi:uncharacterized membrane protein
MIVQPRRVRSRIAHVAYELLNPIPFGCFVAALIFDVAYASNANVLWAKSAAWLLALGLIVSIIPRLINLVHVWLPARQSCCQEKLSFFLNGFAVVAAILNSFVHSRDAFGVMPQGLWLSVLTVLLAAAACILTALGQIDVEGTRHE